MLSDKSAYSGQFKMEINLFLTFSYAITYGYYNPKFPTLTTETIYFLNRE